MDEVRRSIPARHRTANTTSESENEAVERSGPLDEIVSRLRTRHSWKPKAKSGTSDAGSSISGPSTRHTLQHQLSGSTLWLSTKSSAGSTTTVNRRPSFFGGDPNTSGISLATTALEYPQPPSAPGLETKSKVRDIQLPISLESIYNPWWYTTRRGPLPNKARSLLSLAAGLKTATAGLLAAASVGDTLLVLRMLALGAETRARNSEGRSALTCAFSGNHQAVVQVLLNEVTDEDADYEMNLCNAAMQGNEAIVQLFLNRGIAMTTAGGDALRAAASRGQMPILGLLLAHRVAVNQPDSLGETALHKAATGMHMAALDLLLDFGGDIDAPDKDFSTPLHCAVLTCHVMAVALLLRRRADVNADSILYGPPLLCAAKCRSERIVELLLDAGADIEGTNRYHQTALSLATTRGHEGIVTLLLNRGADIQAFHAADGMALSVAAHNGHANIVRLLLDRGASINGAGGSHQSPLSIAAARGHLPIVTELLDRGADIDAINGLHATPLYAAAYGGHWRIAELLLDRGADIDATGGNLQSPLGIAAARGHLLIVTELLDRGADIEAVHGVNATPLYMATAAGHRAVAQLLQERGAQGDWPIVTGRRDSDTWS